MDREQIFEGLRATLKLVSGASNYTVEQANRYTDSFQIRKDGKDHFHGTLKQCATYAAGMLEEYKAGKFKIG